MKDHDVTWCEQEKHCPFPYVKSAVGDIVRICEDLATLVGKLPCMKATMAG